MYNTRKQAAVCVYNKLNIIKEKKLKYYLVGMDFF